MIKTLGFDKITHSIDRHTAIYANQFVSRFPYLYIRNNLLKEATQSNQATTPQTVLDAASSQTVAEMQVLETLKDLTGDDMYELLNYGSSSECVNMTIDAVFLLLGLNADHNSAEEILTSRSLLGELRSYRVQTVMPETIHRLGHYIHDPMFQPNDVSKVSKTASRLCAWCHAVYTCALPNADISTSTFFAELTGSNQINHNLNGANAGAELSPHIVAGDLSSPSQTDSVALKIDLSHAASTSTKSLETSGLVQSQIRDALLLQFQRGYQRSYRYTDKFLQEIIKRFRNVRNVD